MLVIPAMDLLDNQVVRLTQGNYSQVTIYQENPLALAKKFRAAGFSRLHVVDLTGARQGRPYHQELLAQIKKTTGMQIEAGGGIRTVTQVRELLGNVLDQALDYVMIGSLPFLNFKEFCQIVTEFPKNILLTVDVWGKSIKIAGWQKDSQETLLPFLEKMISLGLHDFLVTQIQKDGTLTGPDIALYQQLVKKFPTERFIASGGISSITDLKKLKGIGLYGAILGKAYYAGQISLEEAALLNDAN